MRYTGRRVALIVVLINTALWIGYHPNANLFPIILLLIHGILIWWMGQRYDRFQYFSERDFLTGVYNRMFVYNVFSKIVTHADKNNTKLMTLIIDVDDFKQINDLHGHETGDTVLQIIAGALTDKFGKKDVIARWGGDEFLVISNYVEKYAEKTIHRFHKELIELSKKIQLPIKVTVGIAVYPDDAETLDNLIRLADQKMYMQKIGKTHSEK